MPAPTNTNARYSGFNQFIGDDDRPYGSFEVFQVSDTTVGSGPGWYWWLCFPGCVPDGEAIGPFTSAKEAYDDAIGD